MMLRAVVAAIGSLPLTLSLFLLDLLSQGGQLVPNRLEWCGKYPLDHFPDKLLNIFPLHIPFDIDPISGLALMQRGDFVGVGDNGAGKFCGCTVKDRQTNTIDCNRAFLHEVAAELGWESKGIQKRIAFRLNGCDVSYSVNMTKDEMAGETVLKPERAFQIHTIADLELSKGRASQRLG